MDDLAKGIEALEEAETLYREARETFDGAGMKMVNSDATLRGRFEADGI